MPKPSINPNPPFLETARAFYAEAFDHKKKRDLARSMEEWGELEEDEQSFTVAHLLFLNLHAQAASQKLLTQVRDLLDEVAESLTTAIEESLPPEPGEQPEPDDGVEEDDAATEPPSASPLPASTDGGGA